MERFKSEFLTAYKVFKRSDIERDGTVNDIDFGDWLLRNGDIAEEEYKQKQNRVKENLIKSRLRE